MSYLVELSKTLSYALRHDPKSFDITLDEEGWTSLSGLIEVLKKRNKFKSACVEDIWLSEAIPAKYLGTL